MKIAIISDTHDSIWRLAQTIEKIDRVDAVIHCGDLCSPFVGKQLGEAITEIPVHIVWGNNDGDKQTIVKVASPYSNLTFHGEFADLEIDGKRVAINHYNEIAKKIAESNVYDLVCYGHNHIAHQENIGNTILFNPGEVMGLFEKPSFTIWDTTTRQFDKILLA
jgi:uncharacterized protein